MEVCVKTVAVVFSGIFLVEGVQAFIFPEATQKRELGKFTPPSPASAASISWNPWIPLTHSRTATFGAILLHLIVVGEWHVVGIVLSYGIFVGIVDAAMAYRYGTPGKGMQHLVPTAVLGLVGFMLMRL
jgi:hypothetical protein